MKELIGGKGVGSVAFRSDEAKLLSCERNRWRTSISTRGRAICMR